ncbi:cardiolipin synthase [Aerococcaceae bacterium NML171108]|nr:cardiolipin synthase [Aerococcaceae bacterium NML171108]
MSLPRPKFSTGRVVLLLALFIIQIIWFTTIIMNIVEYSLWIDIAFRFLSVMIVLFLLRKDESPAYRMSWTILIILFPIFGGLFYFLFGNKRTTKEMAHRLTEQLATHRDEMANIPSALPLLATIDTRQASLAYYIQQHAEMPVYPQSPITYYACGEAAFPDIIQALERAERYIFLEFFIIKPGEMADTIFEVLRRKAAEGIEVRLIYDDYGTMLTLPSDFDAIMERQGIKCLKFNPFTPILSLAVNTRDHRKIIVVDGIVGFTGGVNLADEYINSQERFGYWKDNMIQIQGAAVWNLTTMFLNMWNAFRESETSYEAFRNDYLMEEAKEILTQPQLAIPQGFVQPFGDTPLDFEPLGENVYRDILNQATDYVYIYTPYLVISYELQTAMTLAAKRGVDVRLMTPGIPDKKLIFRITRSYYRALLEGGVRIFEYSPGFLHAKTFVSDDCVASVGSINLDYRSLYLHFELNTMLYYHPVITTIKADFLEAQSVSREIYLEDCKGSFLGKMWDSILRLAAPFV